MAVTAAFGMGLGPLVSWGTFTFKAGRTLNGQWEALTADDQIDTVSSVNRVDVAGLAVESVTLTATWLYMVKCDIGGSSTQIQDEIDNLFNAWLTVNGDGTTGQVALLTVKKLGYPAVSMTGKARLLSIRRTNQNAVRQELELAFRLPQGLTG